MNIVQITPGAGKMFCGGCFRDNALVAALRKRGHNVTMVPLYLPLTLEDEDQTVTTPIFFGGINVYLAQKLSLFRKAPEWLHDLLNSPALLKATSHFASKTNPADVGDLTISMLRGEEGNQKRELDELIAWLKEHEKPEIISLSNVLLAGMARQLKKKLHIPIVCSLQGEDSFLDGLPETVRELAWKTLRERAVDIDLFIAPSHYFADLMGLRLQIPREKIKVVYNGISLEGFPASLAKVEPSRPPVLGYFARLCPQKGLDLLVDAYIEIRKRGQIKNLKLKIGGSSGPSDEAFVQAQKNKLKAAGLLTETEFHPNATRAEKIEFLKSLTVFSVPALYGEAFGLYIIEAWAAGLPVVQPKHAAFPELIKHSGAGVISEPFATDLAKGIETLLLNPVELERMTHAGLKSTQTHFTADHMAQNVAATFQEALQR